MCVFVIYLVVYVFPSPVCAFAHGKAFTSALM